MAPRTSLAPQPHLYIGDAAGRPLDNGKIFFGQPDKDPEFFPINIFYDEALTIAALQPVRSKGGFMDANGDMVEIYANEEVYSIKVLDSYGVQVFYKPDMRKTTAGNSITIKPDFTGAVNRSLTVKASEQVSVKDFGALGDGSGETVSHWYTVGSAHYRGYASLAAVQVDYPHITVSTDTIDYAGCQQAFNSGIKKIYAEAGHYVLSKPLRTKHSASFFNNDTGITFFGDGNTTIFSRAGGTGVVASRVPLTATDEDKAAADVANSNEAVLAIHGSNNIFSGFRLTNGAVGLYFGQDHNVTQLSSVCHNMFSDVLIRRCGTGYISAAANGNAYNYFDNIHFVECQIDAYLKNGARWTGSDNNNRNSFYKIKSARSRVGLWIESGDSNVIDTWHGEGCGEVITNNTYPVPTDLPGGIKSGVHIIGGQLNRIHNSQMENNDIELYNYGYNNEYSANGYHEGDPNGTQVINATEPATFISQFTFFKKGMLSFISNVNALAFPNVKRAAVPTFSGSAIYNNVPEIRHVVADNVNARKARSIRTLTAFAKNTTAEVVVWKYGSIKTLAADIKVTVVAMSTVDIIVTKATADVIAIRNSAGSVSGYGITNVVTNSVRDAGIMTTNHPLTLTLTLSGNDLILNIQAPPLIDIASATVYIESLETKPLV